MNVSLVSVTFLLTNESWLLSGLMDHVIVPQGAIFLFFAGRTEEMKGNIDKVRSSSTKLDPLFHARFYPL